MRAEARRAEGRTRARRDARRARRRRAGLVLATLLAGAILFFAGIAIGRALEEAPRPGGTQTLVRTLVPGTAPAATQTVTVTTTAP